MTILGLQHRRGGPVLFLQNILDEKESSDDLQQHAGDADTEILEAKGEGAEHQRLDE